MEKIERFCDLAGGRVACPDVDAFLEEIIEVCKRNGFSLSHEDPHGGFEVIPYSEACSEWMWDAAVRMKDGYWSEST